MAVEFKAIAAEALARASVLLPEWLKGGRRVGQEWIGARTSTGGPGDSWSCNLRSGAWIHGAGDEAGGDLISLYAALNGGISQQSALMKVAEMIGHNEIGIKVLPARPSIELPDPIPQDPPAIESKKLGAPTYVHRYEDQFVVARWETINGTRSKEIRQFTWWGGQWESKGYDGLRVLYRRREMLSKATLPVLVVEGERCVEIAESMLTQFAIVTWSQGVNAVKKTDWAALRDRDVLIWPDADEAGSKASAQIAKILAQYSSRVRVIRTDHTDGWDVADAIQIDQWDAAKITEWMTPLIKTVYPPEKPVAPVEEPKPVISIGDYEDSPLISWQSLGLDTNQGGLPYPTLANGSRILQIHPKLTGKIWYDTFQRKVWHTLRGAKSEWEDSDAADLTVFIQQSMHLPKFTTSLVHEAANHAARRASRNSLTDWLSSLKWDGTERLDTWLSDIVGVDRTEYLTAVSRNWLVSMVARAYQPGCQVDTMPVLEGQMGRGKSRFLEILGGEWFGTVTTAIGETDFIQEIQGVWLVEIPDMTGFGRREHSAILAAIVNRVDRYRPSYGRTVENRPRCCVLAATSETDDYLTDVRGRRRFWPIRCVDIDLDILREQRDRLFAEAVARFREGHRWYEMPDETDREQLDRMQEDLWTEQVLNYVDGLAPQLSGGAMKTIALPAYVLHDVLKIELADQTQVEKNRIAGILQRAGWIPGHHKKSRCWIKPVRRAT